MRKIYVTVGLVFLLGACDGGESTNDGGSSGDAGDVTSDGGTGDAGETAACDGVVCGDDATCDPDTGACACNDGFRTVGDACVAMHPDDPWWPTEAEACAAWGEGHVENAGTPWSAGSPMCDPGTMSMEAIDDTLRRVNMFRYLAGLADVPYDGSAHDELMECAGLMSHNDSLSHDPPPSWDCWTSGGADAAGRSNIAFGYGTPGNAIDGYMLDRNTPSLGHRRWILQPDLASVEVGFSAAGGRPGQCLGVFERGEPTSLRWTAYPNPGFAPIGLVQSSRGIITWSLHANSFGLTGSVGVTVENASTGESLAVDVYTEGGPRSRPVTTIAWTPQGWEPTAGTTYRITVTGGEIGPITYETTLVDCG